MVLLLCFTASAVAADNAQLVVASFSPVLTEIARAVGGNNVRVIPLVQPGVNLHEYEPTPADLQRLGGARLVLSNGRELESYLAKLHAAAGEAEFFAVGDHLARLTNAGLHWWNSVREVEQATRLLRDEFSRLDPAAAPDFERNAADYLQRLDALDRWVKREVAKLPRDRRVLVTAHDAFADFARDYGFTTLAIEGVNPETEPSARHVAEVIEEMKKRRVPAIFVERTLNPKVTQQITRETGARVGGFLFADGLGPGAAATYAGMLRHNVSTIVEALQ